MQAVKRYFIWGLPADAGGPPKTKSSILLYALLSTMLAGNICPSSCVWIYWRLAWFSAYICVMTMVCWELKISCLGLAKMVTWLVWLSSSIEGFYAATHPVVGLVSLCFLGCPTISVCVCVCVCACIGRTCSCLVVDTCAGMAWWEAR